MELRVRVTTGEHGRDPANGERFLEGFLATHPEAHPVVSQNVADGTLTVSFSVEADDAFAAGPIGGEIFTDGATASGLPVSEVVDVAVTLADVGSEDEARELQPA